MKTKADFETKNSFLRDEVNNHIRLALGKESPQTLFEPMRYTLEAGGKRLRPVLLLLACQAVGGDYKDALDAAVAVELLHNFTLIHDDVMDNDDRRRGHPTVHRKWDTNVAILAGDGLVALSYRYLLRTKHPDLGRLGSLFSNTLLELCEGQAYDREFETERNVALKDYFKMIRKKTGALLSSCGELGALIGGEDEKSVIALKEFGLNLGIAFQIQDDLLDVTAEEEQLGKTWGSDIRQKKKTILLIHALNEASQKDREVIGQILAKPKVELRDVGDVKSVYQRAGTLASSSQMLRDHFELARKSLLSIDSPEGRNLLENFLDSVIHRTH